jgi:hypothetical protein
MAANVPNIGSRSTIPARFNQKELQEALLCLQYLHAWGDDEQWSITRNIRTRRQQLTCRVTCVRCGSSRVEHMGIANAARLGSMQYFYSAIYNAVKGEKFVPGDRRTVRIYRASKAKITVQE